MKKTLQITHFLLLPILNANAYAQSQSTQDTLPMTIWSANATNCTEIFPGSYIECQAVTPASNIRVSPEQVKRTDVKLLKNLVFSSLIVYEAPCQGSTIAFSQALTLDNFMHPIPFDQPVGFIKSNVKYNGDEKPFDQMTEDEKKKAVAFTYTRAGDPGDIVNSCRMTIISKDTFPTAESLGTLAEHVTGLVETNTQLIEALKQLGNITDIASVRATLQSAIEEVENEISILTAEVNLLKKQKTAKERALTDPSKSEEERETLHDQISTLDQQILTKTSKQEEMKVLLTKLEAGKASLGVSCESSTDGNPSTCQSLIKEIGKPIRDLLIKTSTELDNISTWLQEEITVFKGKAADVKARFGAIDQALSDLKAQIDEAIEQLKQIPETQVPEPTPAP